MSKLLARLSDPARSGVYRVAHDRDIRDALKGAAHDVVGLGLGPRKTEILSTFARDLDFPAWFGGNWDALEDCLTDLSWREKAPRVLILGADGDSDDLGILRDVLAAVAEFWRGRGSAFFAVFVDPDGGLDLPALYKARPVGPG